MKRSNIFLILILILAFLLRFFYFGEIPKGFSSDEAAIGYNAYSILKTGKDEYGNFLPLSFKSFGEYKAPLYIYATIPFIAVFGLSEFATRLPAAIFGGLTVIVVYILIKKLFKNENLGLVAAFLLAISPWHLQYTRIAYEGSLALFLLSLGILFLLQGFERKHFYYLCAVSFALTAYSHFTVRVFIPLLIIALVSIYWHNIMRTKKEVIISGLIALVLIFPLLSDLFSPAGLTRAKYISLFTDKGQLSAIEQKQSEHLWSNQQQGFFAKVLHNKFTEYSSKFIGNYLAHFDFSFLFIKGDDSQFFKTPDSGLLLLVFLPFLLFGFYQLFHMQYIQKGIILCWLFLAPVSSALTRLNASSNRAFIMVLPITIIITLGVIAALSAIKRGYRKFLLIILVSVIVLEYIFYLDNYYIHLSLRYVRDTFTVTKNTVLTIKSLQNKYQQVWITHKLGGYIHLLFYLQYPAAVYQKQAQLGPLNEYGFGEVSGFDKYKFTALPQYFDFSQNLLYVVTPEELPNGVIPLRKVIYPDGSDAFVLFDTSQLQNKK